MSRALKKVAPLKPELRLAQAISELEASLSNEQKSTFRTIKSQSLSSTPTHSDVMRLTAEMDRQISRKFSGQCFGPRFTNFIQGIQQFAALGDVVVGGSQNLLACGVWSLVHMSLLSIVSVSNYVDKLSSIFMSIGRTAPRHQAMALLYPTSAKLQHELNEYLIVVVNLCHYLFSFGQKSAIQQFSPSLSDARLIGFQADLEKLANSIKEEIQLLEAQESSEFRAVAKGVFSSTSYQQKYATKMRVLDYCSRYDHVTTWKQTRKAGNTSFHQSCAEYQDWKNYSHASTLIYTGKLGSGKSVLLANIVEDINLTTEKEKALVACFFCRHDIIESLLARTIVRSLSRQLLCTVPDLDALAKSCEDTHYTSDTEKLLDLLFRGFPASLKVYFILDGLDECDSKEKQTVVDAVRKIQGRLNVSVCTSFRPEPSADLRSVVDQLAATHIIPLPKDNPDIDSFVEASLTECLNRGKLQLGDPKLIIEIQDALLRDSDGMFLWVSLQIQSLCRMHTDHAIREALADLPKDLAQTFSRILKRVGGSDRSLQVKILQVVLAAYRPLTTDELREALSVTTGDTTWDPSKVLNDVYSALTCCGCLLYVDEEEFTVRVVHHSVKQYILHDFEGADCLGFPWENAQGKLADIVVTYLLYDVFNRELSKSKIRPVMVESAPTRVLFNTIERSLGSRNLAMRLLKSRKQPAFDMSKTIAEARGSFHSKPESGFKFFTYAKTYWPEHVLFVSAKDRVIFKLSDRLIHSRMSELRGPGKNFWRQCQWAVEYGNKNIVELLLGTGIFEPDSADDTLAEYKILSKLILSIDEADSHVRTQDKHSPVGWTVRNSRREIIDIILSNDKLDVNAKDSSGTPLMILAVKHRDKEMVELLLGTGKVDLGATDPNRLTILMTAIVAGYEDMVKLLLITGVFGPTGEDKNGNTPLAMAAYYGYDDIVALLLRIKAVKPYAKDGTGWTPLMTAAFFGHENVVELLLGTGRVDVSATNPEGETAQMLARKEGRKHIVNLLVNAELCTPQLRD